MMFTIEEIARFTGGTIHGSAAGGVAGVSTDSRNAASDELFVPLKGERFDGHDYIPAACCRGVKVFIAERGWADSHGIPAGASCVAVADTLRALGDLAASHRNRFDLPVVGITGSNGKTTTKEMLAAILSLTGPGLKTSGNLNNLIGLPRMLFCLGSDHRWAVLEMGMSEFGEIDRLAEMARPEVGVITNAFAAHLESMGSVESVARAKGELFQRLVKGNTAVVNADDPLISRIPVPDGVRRLSFGIAGGDVRGEEILSRGRRGQSFRLCLPDESVQVNLNAFGMHSISNALAAAAAAHALGMPAETIRAGLENFTPYDKRFNLEELGDIVLIDDSYNANPASVAAALRTVRDLREECGAVAVLGDMLELGAGAAAAHREIGELAASCVDRLYVMGALAGEVAAGATAAGMACASVVVAETHEGIVADLEQSLAPGDLVLVKGSRGMRMERVAEALRVHNSNKTGKGTGA